MGISRKRNNGQRTQETSISDVWKDLNSSPLDGNDPGGRCSVPSVGNEIRVIRWAD